MVNAPSRRLLWVLVVAALAVFPALSMGSGVAGAQTSTGTVTGTVTDPSGAPFPPGTSGVGACPAPGTGLGCPGLQTAFADASGHYTLSLSPGTYNIGGFAFINGNLTLSAPVNGVTLIDGQTITEDFTVTPPPPVPMQMDIAACPNVTQTTDPGPGVEPGNLNCGPSVFSPGAEVPQPDGTCTSPTNSALGTVPESQNPLGLWVHVSSNTCNPGLEAVGGSFTINLTQTAPTPGPTQTIPGQLDSYAPTEGLPPASVVIPIGNLAPGTYNVTVNFPAQTICSQPGSCPFTGPHDVGATSATGTLVVFANSSGGTFVIGDQNASVGNPVTFWGAQWAPQNRLSGGSAPNSFKGFAGAPTTAPACSTQWSTGPGNSSGPPDTVPSYMAVIVTSSVAKEGSTISGNTTKLVIVKTDPGYAANPGHAGTGTVVAVLPCS